MIMEKRERISPWRFIGSQKTLTFYHWTPVFDRGSFESNVILISSDVSLLPLRLKDISRIPDPIPPRGKKRVT
jgi:hypothetical protein